MTQTINLYQVQKYEYDKPQIDTLEQYVKRHPTVQPTKESVQKDMEAYVAKAIYNIPEFFVGTEDEYKVWVFNKTKVEPLKINTSPKLAAYIIRCEEYMTQHLDKITGNAMQSFIGTNGKIDTNALKIVIASNQDKITSMSALCEVYLAWIVYIEGGTQADLDNLPSDDYVKVNIVIDDLWKAQHDSERKALIAKLHSSDLEFAIVDKYSQVASDEPEPEITELDIKQLIRRKKHK